MRQLVRRYVGKRLSDYYAQPADRVVGRSSGVDNSNLSSLLGEWHWRRVLQQFYEEREGHWLTPVELFRPHYSHILADFCSDAVNVNPSLGPQNLDIVELGAGRGTNAKLILSYLRDQYPDIYARLTYTIVDASPSLHELQRETLGDGDHADKVRFELRDLLDVAENKTPLLSKSNTPTVVLGMEVLDNLPHDKITMKQRKRIEQAEVHRLRGQEEEEEVFVPLSDPLLANIVKTVPSCAKPYPVWIPSVACGVLSHVIQQRPNLGLVFADFDWLPAPDLHDTENIRKSEWAEGEPIITDMPGVDHECYLQTTSHCDILFPTDFELLASFAKRKLKKRGGGYSVQVEKQSEFLERFGNEHVRNTKSWLTGHTPLLHDFVNCSVLTITYTSPEAKQ